MCDLIINVSLISKVKSQIKKVFSYTSFKVLRTVVKATTMKTWKGTRKKMGNEKFKAAIKTSVPLLNGYF